MLTDKEKKQRQHEKELKSFRNKMGSNLVWFDSLSIRRKYDLLFEWKEEKSSNLLKLPEISYLNKKIYNYSTGIFKFNKVKYVEYPPSLKHFIKKCKLRNKYRVKITEFRNSAIDLILK